MPRRKVCCAAESGLVRRLGEAPSLQMRTGDTNHAASHGSAIRIVAEPAKRNASTPAVNGATAVTTTAWTNARLSPTVALETVHCSRLRLETWTRQNVSA